MAYEFESGMMKTGLLLLLLLSTAALADQPDRASLISAWENYVQSLPATSEFEVLGDDRYRLEDSELDYAGELKVTGVLIRPTDTFGVETEFSHFGMIEFELVDLQPERLGSQLYYYWLSDRQTLHYSVDREGWVDPKAYQQSFTSPESLGLSLGPLSFMMNYGIWIALLALLFFVFVSLTKQQRKAKSLMDDSADINRMARENLERAERMQKEMVEIAHQAHDLQKQNNALLERIAAASEKRD